MSVGMAPSSRQLPKEQCQPLKVGFGSARALCPVRDVHIHALAVSEARSVVSAWKGIRLNRIMQHIESSQLGNILERSSLLSLWD